MVFMEQVFSYIHDQNNTAIDWISHEGVDIICINIELFTQLTGKRTNTWLQHFSRDTQCENVTSRCRLDKNQFVCFHHPELDRYSPVGVYQSLKKNVKREGFVKQSIANKRQKLKKEIISFFGQDDSEDSCRIHEPIHFYVPPFGLIESNEFEHQHKSDLELRQGNEFGCQQNNELVKYEQSNESVEYEQNNESVQYQQNSELELQQENEFNLNRSYNSDCKSNELHLKLTKTNNCDQYT